MKFGCFTVRDCRPDLPTEINESVFLLWQDLYVPAFWPDCDLGPMIKRDSSVLLNSVLQITNVSLVLIVTVEMLQIHFFCRLTNLADLLTVVIPPAGLLQPNFGKRETCKLGWIAIVFHFSQSKLLPDVNSFGIRKFPHKSFNGIEVLKVSLA